MLSKKNRQVTSKLSEQSYDFVQRFCKIFGISQSSFIQNCVDELIFQISDKSHEYYKYLADYIKQNYDLRRK